MSAISDYYKTLNVGMGSSKADVLSAYRTAAKRFHPDRFRSKSADLQQEATRRMQAVNEAYDILKDPERRRAYDRLFAASTAPRPRSNPSPSPRPTPASSPASAPRTGATSNPTAGQRAARQDTGASRPAATPPPRPGAFSAGRHAAQQNSRPVPQKKRSVLRRFLSKKLFVVLFLGAVVSQMMSAQKSPANTGLPEFHQFPAAESAKAPASAGETHFGLTPQPAAASPTVKKAAAASPRSNEPARFSGIWSDGIRILDFDSTKDGWHPIYNVVNTRYAPRKGELVGHFQIDNGSVIRTRPLHSKNQKSGIVGLSQTATEMTIKSGGGIATLVRID